MRFHEPAWGKIGWVLAALLLVPGVACSPPGERPSVLLITLDTTRADRLGAYGREQAGTRNLDALAREGALFEWAFTTVPITLPAHASILTGTYPDRHGVHDNGWALPPEPVTLAEAFGEADYRTAAFVSAFPLYAQFGLDRGFELYDDELPRQRNARRNVQQRFAQEVVEAANAWLASLAPDEPFFLWVHFYDPHNTYLPPPPYTQWYASDLYQGEIAYMDEWIGKLLDRLAESGRADDTIVAVVADHGESLGEHGERTHAELVYNSTMRVPLILRGAGVDAGLRVTEPVSVVDLLPTLLDLASLETPQDVQGISLAPALRGESIASPRSVYFESLYSHLHHGWSELRSIVRKGWKYIDAPAASSEGELFAIVEDPDELNDRIADYPEVAKRLREELDQRRLPRELGSSPGHPPTLDTDEQQQLEALGYLTTKTSPLGESDLHPKDGVKTFAIYQDAINRIQGGRPRLAIPLIEKIERDYPGSLLAHKVRGRFWIEIGEDDPSVLPLALEALESALAMAPDNPDERRYVAEAHFALGDWPTGLRVFAEATRSAPHRADLRKDYNSLIGEALQRVETLDRDQRHGEALALAEALVEVEPEDPRVTQRLQSFRRKRENP